VVVTAKVRALKTLPDTEHADVMDVVLDWLIEREDENARSGISLKSVAIVTVDRDGTVGNMYLAGGDVFALVGALEMLRHRIMRDCRACHVD